MTLLWPQLMSNNMNGSKQVYFLRLTTDIFPFSLFHHSTSSLNMYLPRGAFLRSDTLKQPHFLLKSQIESIYLHLSSIQQDFDTMTFLGISLYR
mmetsp:Transcript_18939/g.24609  ORF Transcript_18939/g.24609 Transcript_18939/m.24609 type:complete len:94 (+) Transcript_18939:88-369(+)